MLEVAKVGASLPGLSPDAYNCQDRGNYFSLRAP